MLKSGLFISLLSLACITTNAGPAPNDKLSNQYVLAALLEETVTLQGQGPVSCRYLAGDEFVFGEENYSALGETSPKAQTNLALLCIKQRCQKVPRMYEVGFANIDSVSEKDNREFMQAFGYTAEEIENFVYNQKNMDRSKLNSVTCANSTQLARTLIVTYCLSTPMGCSE